MMKKHLFRSAVATATLGFAISASAATEWSTQDYDLHPGDFDGDGKTDLLYVARDPAKASGIARSDGGAPNIPFQSWPSNHLGIPWHNNLYGVIVADFNGDQKSDLLLQRASAGDSFLLLADANGKITAISQTIANSTFGLLWSADQRRIVAGDFSGDGKADLFLQATSPTGTHAVVIADSNGQFTSGPAQSWDDSGWSAFKWSTRHSNVFVGDFNGDGRKDLLLQARPNIVLIDYEVPIPVPTYPPNMNGVVLSQGGTSPMQQAGVQQWSRTANGVDWAPHVANVIVGDFDGNGTSDVLLQARAANRPSHLLAGNAAGAAFTSASPLAANVTWSADSYRLIAGNFDGTGGAGVYYQAVSSSGTNYYANVITGGTVTATVHDAGAATGVLPTSAVGHTVGSFAVTDTGAATYSIPIVVPSGVAGVQPALSINYASGSGNGLLGIGWSLSGLSEISRCNKTLVQDNSTDAVKLTAADRFCIDGNKLRLTGGTYGAASSTYQTELETFAKVTANGTAGNGPASFTVQGKDGLTYEYGGTADSRIESLNPSASTTARAWALSKVTDRAGNYMTIAYQEDSAPNGSYRPDTITYTANSAASLTGAYRVVFNWGTRPVADQLQGYFAGGVIRETKRLVSIETQYDEPGIGWRLVRKYHLSYNTSGASGRSRLAAVQECERNGSCLAPTTIGWQGGTQGWASTQLGSITLPASAGDGIPMEMNGDGRHDYVYFDSVANYWKVLFANSDGTYQSPVNLFAQNLNDSPRALPMDVNGDGRRDLLFSNAADGKWWWVQHVNGTLMTIATTLSYTTTASAYVADVNGDGLEDVVSASTTTLYVSLNSSNATVPIFGPPVAAWTTPAQTTFYTSPFGFTGIRYASEIERADFDGDGREEMLVLTLEDLCGGEPGCTSGFIYDWRVLRWNGSAFVEAGVVNSAHNSTLTRPLLADLDADGITDLIYGRLNSSTWTWRYRLGLGAEVNTGVTARGNGAITDCDADGYADLVALTSTGDFQCMRSDGAGLSATAVNLGQAGGSKVSDVNGDGLLDFVELDTSNVMKVRLHKGVVADFVSSIADGFGNTVSVAYAPLTDPNVYTKGSGATYPNADIQVPMYVVKEYSATDGTGGSYTMTRSYSGARTHAHGRGFLGFASTTSSDSRTTLRTTSTFRQDYPYVGFVAQTTTRQSATGPIITQVTNTPAELPVQGGAFNERRYPYLAQSVQESYEIGGAGNGLPIARVTAVTTIDPYGNPTNVTTTTADLTGSGQSFQTVAVNTYDTADAHCWWLGFVTEQTVTNIVPGLPAQTRTVQFEKDTASPSACRVQKQVVEPADDAVKVTTTFGYDPFGHPSSQTVTAANISARTTTTSYGTSGVFPLSVTEVVTSTFNHVASRTYDFALGVPKTATDPNGLVVEYQYDGFGRLIEEKRPDQTKTVLSYSACGVTNSYCGDSRLRYQVEKRELDASGGIIRSARQLFDGLGRALYEQSQTLSGAYSNVATNYDNQGRPYQRSQPYFTGFTAYFATTTYDSIGRPVTEQRRISETDSGMQTVTYGYDRLVHTQADANGKVTQKHFNAIGQIVKMTDAANGITQYEYDQFGNLTKTIDPAGNQIVNTFNIRGFKLSTNDPDMGSWVYTYYPTGELHTQRDAKNQLVTFTYDALSRPLTREEPEGTTTFTYGTSQASRNIGKLTAVNSPGAYSESYTFDSLGRIEDATTNADGASFAVSHAYNAANGLLEAVTYPTSTAAVPSSRFKVKYEYSYGLLKRTSDFNSPAVVYWEQIATNAAGQAIDEQLGNGLHTYSAYDGITGLVSSIATGASSQVQNLSYAWNKVGNLTQRRDVNRNLTETFSYDDLYRLDQSHLNGVPTPNLDMAYDALGNITSKTEGASSSSYNYSTQQSGCTYYTHAQPHAVRKVGTNVYCYDQNGNMTQRAGSSITWYSYNLPNRIDHGSNYSQFFYGAGRNRYKQVAFTAAGGSLPAGTETTIYVRGLFERVTKPSGVIEYKHYILAGNDPVAIRTLRSSGTHDTRYLHKDHLGSVETITDESGGIVAHLSFDAFGKRRSAVSWSGPLSSAELTLIAGLTHRGYTFHEGLDNVDLIHMNGRVYDPNIARFISADPFIQAPFMSQSLNRYSYVMNNPLSLIDPSGFFSLSKGWKKLKRAFKKVWGSFWRDLNTIIGSALVFIGTLIPPLAPLIPIGQAIIMSPVRAHRGPDGIYVSFGYNGFGLDSRSLPKISGPTAPPPPMTAPPGAISLSPLVPESAVDGTGNVWGPLTSAGPSNSFACAKISACGNRGDVSADQAITETLVVGGVVTTGVFSAEIGAGAAAVWNGAKAAARNVSFDGPSSGLLHGEGRVFGVRWKGSQWGFRLDLHTLGRGPEARRVLHINFGSPYGKEGAHIPLFDPRWFRFGE